MNTLSKIATVLIPEKGSKKVYIRGNNVFHGDVIVPKGYQLIVEAGATINLVNRAALISHSPVTFKGTEDKPIRVHSADKSANGVIILSTGKSSLSHTVFENLNTMNKNNWTLTGAVTFYGGDVSIDHCTFTENHCEDGLNLIRCHFDIQHSTVSNALSDGLDADFCTGTLRHSTFEDSGNDCIDFSGSEMSISYCKIINAGDKGISGGEDSRISIQYCTVEGAHIAFASKDLSEVTISNCTILEAAYGFSAYRKKPEYGAAKLIVTSMKKMNATKLHLLEKGSSMTYMGKEYHGTEKFDIDAMYAMYAK